MLSEFGVQKIRQLLNSIQSVRNSKSQRINFEPNELQILKTEVNQLHLSVLEAVIENSLGERADNFPVSKLQSLLSSWSLEQGSFDSHKNELLVMSESLKSYATLEGLRSLSRVLGRFGFFETSFDLTREYAFRVLAEGSRTPYQKRLGAAIALGDLDAFNNLTTRLRLRDKIGNRTDSYNAYGDLWNGNQISRLPTGSTFRNGERWVIIGPRISVEDRAKFFSQRQAPTGAIQFAHTGSFPAPIRAKGVKNMVCVNSTNLAWIRDLPRPEQNSVLQDIDAVYSSAVGFGLNTPKSVRYSTRLAKNFSLIGSPQIGQHVILEILLSGASLELAGLDFYAGENPYAKSAIGIDQSLEVTGTFRNRPLSRCCSLALHGALENWQMVKNVSGRISAMDTEARESLALNWRDYARRLESNFGSRRL